MKKLIILLLISFNLSAQTIPQDKMLHFSGCYIASATTTTIASYYLPKKQAFWVGVSVGTAVGLAKDAYERYQELEAMSPEQREDLARERDEFSFGEFGGA